MEDMGPQTWQNESELVCKARQGDKEAMRILLMRNWAWLKALVYSVVCDANDVDDVLQDICVRLISKIDTLRQPQRFRPWLAVLAKRQALRFRQQKKKRPVFSDEELIRGQCDEKSQQFLENIGSL